MACCKAENYKWCDELETVRHEGQEYCIFHAPAECAEKQDVEAFNKLVFQRIDKAKEVGNACNLSGTIFPGDITFSHYGRNNKLIEIRLVNANFRGNADFQGVSFSGDAYYYNAIFSQNADFRNADFVTYAYFGWAVFTWEAFFGEATFNGGAYFRDTNFRRRADFRGATFQDRADFFKAVFTGDAYFRDSDFEKMAYFRDTNFNHHVYFEDASFSGKADFSKASFSGEASFKKVSFSEEACFENAYFSMNAIFQAASFNGNAVYIKSTFSDKADFTMAVFTNPALFKSAIFSKQSLFNSARFALEGDFSGSELGEANFNNCQFEKPAFLRQTTFSSGRFDSCFINHRLEFDQVNLVRVSFLGAPLEDLLFIDCTWPVCKGRKVVYDARLVNGKGYYPLHNAGEPQAWEKDDVPPTPGALADLFRRLKKIAISEQDHALASDWHFNEKDMVRRDHWLRVSDLRRALGYALSLKKRWWRRYKEHTFRPSLLRATLATAPRSLKKFFGRHPLKSLFQNLFSGISLELYRASSGYGERPLRAIFLLLAFVAAPIISSSDPGGFIPLVPAKPNTAGFWLPFAKGLWRLLITVQAGMFALAVRNRMRR